MIPIRSVISLHNLPTKGSIHEKMSLLSLQSPLKRRERELQLTDNLLGTGQSIYELATILGVEPTIRPILFSEKLNQLKLNNEKINQQNQELARGK